MINSAVIRVKSCNCLILSGVMLLVAGRLVYKKYCNNNSQKFTVGHWANLQ